MVIPEKHKKRMKKTLPNRYTLTGNHCETCRVPLTEENDSGYKKCRMCR